MIGENCHTHDIMLREDTNYPFLQPLELDLLTYILLTRRVRRKIPALKEDARQDCETIGEKASLANVT